MPPASKKTSSEKAPSREAPSREAPSREAPSREAPSREFPSREAPSREAPSREAPAFPLPQVLEALTRAAGTWSAPVVTFIAQTDRDPFLALASCLLSLRTRDETTNAASQRLFARARGPAALLTVAEGELARLIYPVGFYRTKARTLHQLAAALLERHEGQVPADLEALLALPGVGRKTANLVLSQAFGLPAICVDTHVHRIPNRWGLVRTKTPEETERALARVVPQREWARLNPLLVAFGQTICHPTSPRCSQCPVAAACARVGVTRSR